MSGGQTSTNTVSQSSQPPAAFQNAYTSLLGQVQQTGATPYQQYSGNLVAPFSPDQNSGIAATENAQGVANPYINSASQYISNATTPLWPSVQQFSPQAVQQYESPYTNDVLKATIASENNQDAQQQQGLAGQAISAGAWGGDRAGVAQGILGGQQAIANNATNAGILNQGYGQALNELNTQQSSQLGANEANAWLNSQAGAGMANLGNEALNSSLTGANALLSTGSLEQQLAQEGLNIPYEQYQAQQAYPFQTESWLQGLETNLGSSAGGTGTTTTPSASPFSQIAGIGTGIAGLAGAAKSAGLIGGTTAAGSADGLSSAGAIGSIGAGFDTGAGLGSAAALSSIGDAGALAGGDIAASLAPLAFAQRGGIIPFPTHRVRGGGIMPANDDGWAPMPRRATGGIAPMLPVNTSAVSTIPASYAGGPAVPQLATTGGGGILPGGALPPAISSYLSNTAAGASHDMPAIYTPPAPPSAASADLAANPMAYNQAGEPVQGIADWEKLASDYANIQANAPSSSARGGIIPMPRRDDGGALDSLLSADPHAYDLPPDAAGDDALPVPPDYVPPPPASGAGIGGHGHALQRVSGPPAAPPPAQSGPAYPAGGIAGGLDAVSRLTSAPSSADSIHTPPSGANPWLALADAGFSMAAGKSPHPLENIAAGAAQGVHEFTTADRAAKQLSMQAEEAKARLAETDSFHQATVANTANRNSTYADAAANRHQDAQDKMMNALALAQARAGAHTTPGDLMNDAINSMKGTVNPDTQQPYTPMELFHIANGLTARTDQGNRRLDQGDARLTQGDTRLQQGQNRIDLGQANNAQRQQAQANNQEDAGALKIMNAAALAGKPISYSAALQAHRSGQGAAGPAVVPQAAPRQAAAPAPPAVGEVRQGYSYQGGDPSSPQSWKLVQ